MNGLMEYEQTSGTPLNYEATNALCFDEQKEIEHGKFLRQLAVLTVLRGEMDRLAIENAHLIEDVRSQFVLPVDHSVIDFLLGNRAIPQLLLESIPYIRHEFGETAVLNLRAPVDDSGAQILYAVIMWSGAAKDARDSLTRFDEAWWLSNCRRASGNLYFTYELV